MDFSSFIFCEQVLPCFLKILLDLKLNTSWFISRWKAETLGFVLIIGVWRNNPRNQEQEFNPKEFLEEKEEATKRNDSQKHVV
jgi:hypothetical protein